MLKFETSLVYGLILVCLSGYFGLMLGPDWVAQFGPDWVVQWSWLVNWVALLLLLTASLAFSFATYHFLRARGSARRPFLVGVASFAVAALTLGTLHAAIIQKKGGKNANELKGMQHLSIFTGHSGQSYFKFGQAIANLAYEKSRVTITNVSTAGSEDNLYRLENDATNESIALVQDDVLEERRKTNTKLPFQTLLRLPRREEVHIVTLSRYPTINSIEQLEGKRVAIGERDSGTNFTARLVLGMTRVFRVELVEIGPEPGLQGLFLDKNNPGRVDAVFYVVSQPATLFNSDDFNRRNSRNLDNNRSLYKFVAIPSSELLKKVYKEAYLESRLYNWLEGRDVPTISIGTTLVRYEKTKPQYVNFIKDLIEKNCARFFGDSCITLQPSAGPPE
jgi:TRAP-type uncharacterized transport system substrate-binding protein